MTDRFDSFNDPPATLPEDRFQDGAGPDGAFGPSVQTPRSGMVDSMARRLGAAAPAEPSPDLPVLGSGQSHPLDEVGGSATLGDGAGSSDSEMDPEDVDLHAEYALAHIGLAALTSGYPAPAQSLVGIIPDPSTEDGAEGSGAGTPAAPEDMEPPEETEDFPTSSAAPGSPDAELPAESSDVQGSPQQDVPTYGTPPMGPAASGDDGAAPQQGDPDLARPKDPVDALKYDFDTSYRDDPPEDQRNRVIDLQKRLRLERQPGETSPLANPEKRTRHRDGGYQGGTRAWRNQSPGNLKEPGADKMEDWHNRFGAEKADNGFLKFPSVEKGLGALQDLLSDDGPYHGLTVRDGIRSYAGLGKPGDPITPEQQKHLDDYLKTLKGFGVDADRPMLEQRERVIPGIIQQEGYYPGIKLHSPTI